MKRARPSFTFGIIIPPYANKVNCTILLVKTKEKGYDSLYYLAFRLMNYFNHNILLICQPV